MASRSWNRVELIGNLTRDPELRYTPSGTPVATIGLATNRVYTSESERKEEVSFHRIVAWGKLAELCQQLLKKGSRVFISGRLQYREWETQDGQKRREAEIVLEDMILLTPKNGPVSFENEEITAPVEDVSVSLEEVGEENKKETTKPAKAEKARKEETAETTDENIEDADLPF